MSSVYGDKIQQEIAALFEQGKSKAELSRMYSVSPRTIGRYIDTWGWMQNTVVQQAPQEAFSYSFSVTPEKALVIRTNLSTGEIDVAQVNKADDLGIYDVSLEYFYAYLASKDEEYLAGAFDELHKPTIIQNASHGRVTADVMNNALFFTSDAGRRVSFSGRLVERIMDAIRGGDENLDRIMKFADRLSHNPSKSSVDELYDFLEAKDIEIDEEGYLLCYKKVRANYTDCHTGTYDNSPGMVVRLERNEVDEDSNRTCSHGLHVCSFAYLPHFGGSVVVKVKVDPAHVVAIPNDYYSNDGVDVKAKMRVCEYEVLCDLTNILDEEE